MKSIFKSSINKFKIAIIESFAHVFYKIKKAVVCYFTFKLEKQVRGCWRSQEMEETVFVKKTEKFVELEEMMLQNTVNNLLFFC